MVADGEGPPGLFHEDCQSGMLWTNQELEDL